jgi:uncharacterized protein (DUF302 family)
MTTSNGGYAIRRTVDIGFDEADRRVREALESEGFGVLTEIDVRATLKKKLDVDFRRYEILGACKPDLAHRALEADADIGLLLPCNIVVQDGEQPGTTVVEAIDPVVQLGLASGAELAPLAEDVRSRLVRVLNRVAESP